MAGDGRASPREEGDAVISLRSLPPHVRAVMDLRNAWLRAPCPASLAAWNRALDALSLDDARLYARAVPCVRDASHPLAVQSFALRLVLARTEVGHG